MVTEYTLPLALEDFLPVILSAVGLYFLAQMAAYLDKRAGWLTRLGFVLVSLGSMSNAVWKLIMASGGGDITLLSSAVLVLMGPGFCLVAFGIWAALQTERGKPLPKWLWLRPVAIAGAFLLAALIVAVIEPLGRTWSLILLILMALGNAATLILVIRHAWRLDMKLMAAVFVINFIGLFVLLGMQRILDQTVSLQWTEQAINTALQGGFMFSAWQISQKQESLITSRQRRAVATGL